MYGMGRYVFQGKRLKDEKWVTGSLFASLSGQKFISWEVEDDGAIEEVVKYEVDPKTVRQFVAPNSKSGRAIFEGDIVEHNSTLYVVEYSKTQSGFICIDRKHRTRGGYPNWRDGQWLNNVSKYLQVVGNIYDNAAMLENV